MKKHFCSTESLVKILIGLFLVISFNSIAQTTLYVKADASGNNDGTSWTDAYTDLQSALSSASSGDEIWVAAGTYKPTKEKSGNPSTSRYYTFHMVNGVDLYGGFVGNESSKYNRDWVANETILSGDIGTIDDISDNCFTVVTGNSNYLIDGFIITRGNSNSTAISAETDNGGGILNNSVSNVQIKNCRIEDNNANAGAGITNYYCGSEIIISNCIFKSNTAGQAGGIGNWACRSIITNCLFVNNSVDDPTFDFGSGVYNWASNANSEIINCTFYGNSTRGSGGTVHSRAIVATVKNCIFWGNGSDDLAGSSGGTQTVTYSLVQQSGYAGSNGNISSDPLFSDTGNEDFTLSSVSSPAIDAGDPSSDKDPDGTTADMGVYPFFQTDGLINTGITALISPEAETSAGINKFGVTFSNIGTEVITSVTLGLKIDDSVYYDYQWTGNLPSGQTSDPVFIGTHSISAGTPEVKVWTADPNGIMDENKDNDTLTVSIQFNTTPMAGTYTVGPEPCNFEEINHAAQHLMENGASGAVIINIKPGTYDEQVSLGNVSGASSGNSITFQSEDQDSTLVILTYTPSGGDDNFTLKLDNAAYTTFQHMTIQSQGPVNYARVIEIENGSENNAFQFNRILGIKESASGSELIYSEGGVSAGSEDDLLSVQYNLFENGVYGIRYKGWGAASGDNITIDNNQFNEQYYYSIHAQTIDNLQITNNIVDITNSTATWNWGIYLVFCENNIIISGNKISVSGNQLNGIMFEMDNGTGTGGIVSNNFIHLESGNSTKGIGFSSIDNPFKVYHNSIYITGSNANGTAVYISNSSNITVKNNIAANLAGGKSLNLFSNSSIPLDYNNYYSNGPVLGTWESTDAASLADWKTVSGMDANSVSIHPHFISDSDLHTTYGLLDNLGTPLGEVTVDIDGESRDGSNPDMGADEFSSPANDMAVVEFLGTFSDCGLSNTETISFTVTNNGGSAQSNIPVKYSVDQGATIIGPENIPGPVAPGDTVSFSFSTKADLSVPGIYEGGIALSDVADADQNNDTLFITIIHYPQIGTFPFTEDFEASDETFSLQYETGTYGETEIVDWAANGSNYGLRLGSWTSGGWTTQSVPEVWTQNTEQLAAAFTCTVDGTSLTNPRLKLDLRQTWFTGSGGYSWFRVLINDTQVSDIYGISDFTPATEEGQWDTLYFDLSDYIGTSFNIKLQSACRSPGTDISAYGDNVFVDNIVIGDAPVVDLGADQVVCNGETVVLDAGSGAGYTYQWKEVGSGDPFGTSQTLDVTTDGEYMVTVTNSIGLVDMDTVEIIFSEPVANAGTDQNVCYGETVTLQSVTEWSGYDWNGEATTRTVDFTVLKDSTLVLTVTDSIGCTDEDEVIVTKLDLPVVDLGADQSICPGETASLDAGSGFTYVWSDLSTSRILNVSEAGTYWVEVTDGNGCENSDTIDVSLYTAPVVDLGEDVFVCPGEETTFDAGAGYVDYSWSNYKTTQIITVNQAGTYSVTVTDNNGCTGTDEAIFGFYTAPVVDLGSDVQICDGTSSTIDAGAGFDAYLWSDGRTTQTIETDTAGLFSVTVTDANGCQDSDNINVSIYPTQSVDLGGDQTFCQSDSIRLSPVSTFQSYLWSTGSTEEEIYVKEPGTYSVAVTDIYGCSINSEQVVISENPAPTLDLGPDKEVCEGEYITLDPGPDYDSYNWNDGLSSEQTFEAFYTGQYTLTVSNEHGCTATDQINVTYLTPQNVDLGADQYVCPGDQLTLDAGSGFVSYSWSGGSTTQTITVDSAGTYTVEVTDTNGCSDSDEIILSVYSEVDVDLGENKGYCEGSELYLSPATGYFTYEWSDGSTGPGMTVNTAGTYWLKAADANGCWGSDTIQVTEYANPEVDLGKDTTYCASDSYLILDAGADALSYMWSDQSQNQTLTVYNSDVYSVQITDDHGCTANDTVEITINPAPQVSIYFDGELLSTGYAGGVEYIWYLDGEVLTGITGTSFEPDQSGIYQLFATDENGCSAFSPELEIIVGSGTVGIEDQELLGFLAIYPNPAETILYMDFKNTSFPINMRIINMTGKIVFRKEFRRSNITSSEEIDISYLKKGTYIIQLLIDDRVFHKKLLIR